MTTSSAAAASSPADHRAERRQAIVEAAARLFAELGYTDCEMERVASELGIAKGTLYLYFSSKEELFYASVDNGMRQMQKAVNVAADQVLEPFEQISQAIRAYFQFFEDHPEHVELLIQERANFKHRKRPTYFEYREANRGRWRDLWTRLIATGKKGACATICRWSGSSTRSAIFCTARCSPITLSAARGRRRTSSTRSWKSSSTVC